MSSAFSCSSLTLANFLWAADAAVVLDIGSPGSVVPETVVLHGKFAVALGRAEQEIGEVISRERPIKTEGSLGRTEQVLNFLIDRPASSKPELMCSLG